MMYTAVFLNLMFIKLMYRWMKSIHKKQSKHKIWNLDSIKDISQLKSDTSHIVAPDGLGAISLLEKIGEGT